MKTGSSQPHRVWQARPGREGRRGAAAVELVVALPMLCFIMLVTIDYSRLFYAWATLADCARNGAFYASDSNFATSTNYTTAQQAALADDLVDQRRRRERQQLCPGDGHVHLHHDRQLPWHPDLGHPHSFAADGRHAPMTGVAGRGPPARHASAGPSARNSS